jgi:Homeodomain-like domain
VKHSEEERERLNTLIHSVKHPARQLLKASVLLKADVSEASEGWSDSQIAIALEASINTIARTRQRLVEQGFETALIHQHSPASARPRIFDGATETKLIALACSEPPKGRARRTLQLLEQKVVALNIVARASVNTIGRTLKKCAQTPPETAMGHCSGRQLRLRGRHGRCAGSLSQAT